MTTTLDTNVVIALWDEDPALSRAAQTAMERALAGGSLVLSAPVFAELLAAPGRSTAFVDTFIRDTGLQVDWSLNEAVWRAAGRAFQKYATVRRKQKIPGPRRILADFVIGAHASVSGYALLTLDDRLYRTAFPGLRLLAI